LFFILLAQVHIQRWHSSSGEINREYFRELLDEKRANGHSEALQ
jgi:hypothetical protein